MPNDNKCTTLVISCIDYRFISSCRDYLVKLGIKDRYDLLTTPGASISIQKIKEGIKTSLKVHGPNEVYIFDHDDCAVYGKNNSEERHIQNLKKAEEVINKIQNGLKINTYLIKFNKVKQIN